MTYEPVVSMHLQFDKFFFRERSEINFDRGRIPVADPEDSPCATLRIHNAVAFTGRVTARPRAATHTVILSSQRGQLRMSVTDVWT